VSAIWFIVDDDNLMMSVTETTQRYRNLSADRRCTLVLFHPRSANYYAEIRGDATLTPDPDYEFANRLGTRYSTDMRSFDTEGSPRVALWVAPVRINVTDVRG
jgi:hypothetical protein